MSQFQVQELQSQNDKDSGKQCDFSESEISFVIRKAVCLLSKETGGFRGGVIGTTHSDLTRL